MKTRLLPLLLSGLLLLSGCGNADTDSLKATIEQQKQEIAQLKQRLETEALQAKALQSAVNQAAVYEWAGPLRWLPIWDDVELQVGKEVREKRGWAPDWRAWAELAILYIAAAWVIGPAVGRGIGAGIGTLRRMEKRDLLNEKIQEQEQEIRRQEAVLRDGRAKLERLRRSDEQLEAARDELHRLTQEIDKTERRLAAARQKVEAAEQRARDLPNEIEREKSRVLEEYRKQIERDQRAVRQATEKIDRALDDL
jgi:predicted RNase H-like nuclease (RuvC/YqgF family)